MGGADHLGERGRGVHHVAQELPICATAAPLGGAELLVALGQVPALQHGKRRPEAHLRALLVVHPALEASPGLGENHHLDPGHTPFFRPGELLADLGPARLTEAFTGLEVLEADRTDQHFLPVCADLVRPHVCPRDPSVTFAREIQQRPAVAAEPLLRRLAAIQRDVLFDGRANEIVVGVERRRLGRAVSLGLVADQLAQRDVRHPEVDARLHEEIDDGLSRLLLLERGEMTDELEQCLPRASLDLQRLGGSVHLGARLAVARLRARRRRGRKDDPVQRMSAVRIGDLGEQHPASVALGLLRELHGVRFQVCIARGLVVSEAGNQVLRDAPAVAEAGAALHAGVDRQRQIIPDGLTDTFPVGLAVQEVDQPALVLADRSAQTTAPVRLKHRPHLAPVDPLRLFAEILIVSGAAEDTHRQRRRRIPRMRRDPCHALVHEPPHRLVIAGPLPPHRQKIVDGGGHRRQPVGLHLRFDPRDASVREAQRKVLEVLDLVHVCVIIVG